MSQLQLNSQHRCFGGSVSYYQHDSQVCNAPMRFSVFLPPQAKTSAVPVLYFLSGLTCTEENFTVKSGVQGKAAELGIAIIAPDTSPRHTGIPDEDKEYDLGSGAGFYVNATQSPWQQHYQMYSYVVEELPQLVESEFPIIPGKRGIFGHSMGGHGALICALRNPNFYLSVSAFAPIAALKQCAWGKKALTHYLGDNQQLWDDYDATELIKRKTWLDKPILIDQGTEDNFLAQQQLLPEELAKACEQIGQPLNLRYQEGYDHSYFFISSFIADHLQHHKQFLI
ncbi:S-formylglutathione hydrolase [Euhalothece natronophila Z-M001]|uniref:S-formylglutathione hydrolase n=1 Tax=Euhalothece natronophila Z-M001 TaxID=522448 RepID=A0A5B8NHW2_9CHRO|nr:S-formylglutathione hydrolase [Euhalothece natronophila]QDZ38534.1 S-formylglutathione hydrolase [Euhalothece natronophila Z-M001]